MCNKSLTYYNVSIKVSFCRMATYRDGVIRKIWIGVVEMQLDGLKYKLKLLISFGHTPSSAGINSVSLGLTIIIICTYKSLQNAELQIRQKVCIYVAQAF